MSPSNIFPTPRPFPKGSHEQKVYEFYRHGAGNFGDFHGGYLNFGLWEDDVRNYVEAAGKLVHRLGDLLKLTPESRLLDVACGMGPQDVYLVRNFGVRSIDALDLLPEHLAHAERRIREAGFQELIRLHHGTATELPFGNESFSHVLCIEGLVHFNTRGKFFRECRRVLQPGGRIAFADYAARREPRNILERGLLRLVTRLWYIPYENAETPEKYRSRLEDLGFEEVRVHAIGEQVIPGYCREQARPECIAELTRIRGLFAGRIGHVIDIVLDWAYRQGLVEYILVEGRLAEKAVGVIREPGADPGRR